MSRIRVGVVRGGPSSEYVVSLRTGEHVLNNLSKEKYLSRDILITPRGDWYMDGVRTDPANIAGHVDVVWNALHGSYGEDGKVQQLFESFGIPYTGSGVMPSAIGMHKGLAKERFALAGLNVVQGVVVDADDLLSEVAEQIYFDLHLPLIVKPVSGGSSVGIRVAKTLGELVLAMEEAKQYGDILIENYIEGKEATVCVVDSGTPNEHFVLYPIEITLPNETDFFDYNEKYSGVSEEICPGRFPLGIHSNLRDSAIKAHRSVGARHYSRSDFIVTEDGQIYILEINTLPGLTKESLLPKALKASGVRMHEFIDHILELSLKDSGNTHR